MQREDCQPWTGPRLTPDGYGTTSTAGGVKRRYAHVVACEEAHGPRPPGMVARHLCGYAPCVNPDHLAWGTKADDVADARNHGTIGGERNGQAKLTYRSVAFAIQMEGTGMKHREIAEVIGVNQSTITRALSGRTWRNFHSEGTGINPTVDAGTG